ncbi:MAG: DUF362 domain-containing protein [Deltaproteobacteria bacterium]|nr:DUF362 domain-containing protein [Deltaproteobacteria bacterium]
MNRNSVVALVGYDGSARSVERAVESAGGLDGAQATSRVLVKPNLMGIDDSFPYPLFGVITTARVMEPLIRCLAEAGHSRITIGEGSVTGRATGIGLDTAEIFGRLGYNEFKKRYGVDLIDFNEGPFESIILNGHRVRVAAAALEADVLWTVPVLKTHGQTMVSLGLKNLKGCLQRVSKSRFHEPGASLEGLIARLALKLNPAFCLIDGIYALERGPQITGKAWRTDLVIASRDVLSADWVGARLLGFEPRRVEHLRAYAELTDRADSTWGPSVLGLSVDEHRRPLNWDWHWREDNSGPAGWDRLGIRGIRFPNYDGTLCTGCSLVFGGLLSIVGGAYQRKAFCGDQFLTGKAMSADPAYGRAFLFGDCMVRAHRDNTSLAEAVPIQGCPPALDEAVRVMNAHGLQASMEDYARFRRHLASRYENRPEFRPEDFVVP